MRKSNKMRWLWAFIALSVIIFIMPTLIYLDAEANVAYRQTLIGILALVTTIWFVAQFLAKQDFIRDFYSHPKTSGSLFEAYRIEYSTAWNASFARWKRGDLAMMPDQMILRRGRDKYIFRYEDFRWLKQSQGEITFDVNIESVWLSLKLRMAAKDAKRVENIIDEMAAEQGITIKRHPGRRLDYQRAQHATQDLHGAWTLGETVTLLLTPAYLVILQNNYVQREILVNDISAVTAMPRIDAPNENKLVCFVVDNEDFAFALREADTFAEALAQANRSHLEEISTQKKKHENNETINKSNNR